MSNASPINLRISARTRFFDTTGHSSYYYSSLLVSNLALFKAVGQLGQVLGWPSSSSTKIKRGSSFLEKAKLLVQSKRDKEINLAAGPLKTQFYADQKFGQLLTKRFWNSKALWPTIPFYRNLNNPSIILGPENPKQDPHVYGLLGLVKYVKHSPYDPLVNVSKNLSAAASQPRGGYAPTPQNPKDFKTLIPCRVLGNSQQLTTQQYNGQEATVLNLGNMNRTFKKKNLNESKTFEIFSGSFPFEKKKVIFFFSTRGPKYYLPEVGSCVLLNSWGGCFTTKGSRVWLQRAPRI